MREVLIFTHDGRMQCILSSILKYRRDMYEDLYTEFEKVLGQNQSRLGQAFRDDKRISKMKELAHIIMEYGHNERVLKGEHINKYDMEQYNHSQYVGDHEELMNMDGFGDERWDIKIPLKYQMKTNTDPYLHFKSGAVLKIEITHNNGKKTYEITLVSEGIHRGRKKKESFWKIPTGHKNEFLTKKMAILKLPNRVKKGYLEAFNERFDLMKKYDVYGDLFNNKKKLGRTAPKKRQKTLKSSSRRMRRNSVVKNKHNLRRSVNKSRIRGGVKDNLEVAFTPLHIEVDSHEKHEDLTIYLMRSGESSHLNSYLPRKNASLTDTGKDDLLKIINDKTIRQKFKKIKYWFSSDLRRSQETASFIHEKLYHSWKKSDLTLYPLPCLHEIKFEGQEKCEKTKISGYMNAHNRTKCRHENNRKHATEECDYIPRSGFNKDEPDYNMTQIDWTIYNKWLEGTDSGKEIGAVSGFRSTKSADEDCLTIEGILQSSHFRDIKENNI